MDALEAAQEAKAAAIADLAKVGSRVTSQRLTYVAANGLKFKFVGVA